MTLPATAAVAPLAIPRRLACLVADSPDSPFALPKTAQGYARRAQFATMSRLLTCLVNEQLVTALVATAAEEGSPATARLLIVAKDIDHFCGKWAPGTLVFQLRHQPMLADDPMRYPNVRQVLFLDPDDLGLCAWRTEDPGAAKGSESESDQHEWQGAELVCPTDLMNAVAGWRALDPDAVQGINSELLSSMQHQEYAYSQQDTRPELDIRTATTIEWEQSLTEGHATHPMHRARHAMPPLEPLAVDTELRHLLLRFVAVPRDRMVVEGKFSDLIAPLLHAAAQLNPASDNPTQSPLSGYVDLQTEVVVPVHPLHLPAIQKRFPFARVLPFVADAQAQASLRTVSPAALQSVGLDIKLPLGIKTSSALRTISTWSAYLGPRLTQMLPSTLAQNAEAPLVCGEPASVILRDSDPDAAKYLACILRRSPQSLCAEGERAIVAAALTERLSDGQSVVCARWPNMETASQKLHFLGVYTKKLFEAFLPPLLTHGFAFEAHQQNTLVVVSEDTGLPTRFIIRDFGGIMVHMPTFVKATGGIEVPMLPNNSTTAESLDEVYGIAYHTLVQCQLHRLIRALGLHYCGSGWQVVREEFCRIVPPSEPLWACWMGKQVSLKSFVSMKLGGFYRNYLYSSVPNILLKDRLN
ncbi:hypothetical protein IWW45_005320 [Coemansia sp. RSA 485]|nr:hypothetical protein IWW45_005320 [Coemansia sp. RSA 485]